ncbi:MAG: LL-diaminopimelate aminotransferase [Proteobacteria bacterium]|nr:LL-diaminopimelate aminotransferase [Pseudomonadota bacterium]
MSQAERLKKLPPYLFAQIDRIKQDIKAQGVDIIDLGIGDPDQPTPAHIIEKLKQAATDAENHRYPSYEGMPAFRQAVAGWYKKRFGVELDPRDEVVSLIGSKEGIAHIPLAFVNPGERVLVPSPGYPVYKTSTMFAGGIPEILPLRRENGFLPDFSKIPASVLKETRLMFLNYPNNPTAAVAERSFFEEAVALAIKHGIIICHDCAYSEVAFDGYRPHSFLEIDGAREVCIEFHSLSKTYNMTGWRIGFAVGNRDIVGGLGKIKTNIDSGIFQAVQWAGVAALSGDQGCVETMRAMYQGRRDVLVSGLKSAGLELAVPKATFYVWVNVPRGYTSSEFTMHLLRTAGIVTTPGSGFGEEGEGYIRIALTVDNERLKEAVERIKKVGF